MMGRTHSVHAEPTTFGLKLAGWAFELDRGRPRLAAAVDEIGTGKISGPVGTYSHLAPGRRGRGARRPRPARRPGQHPDRPARPARGAPRRDRHHRRVARALRDRGPQPPAHRDRRGPGAVHGRPEGLVGDAPQAQPDPVRADRRPRAAAARLCRARRSRTSRSGTSATSATRSAERVILPDATIVLDYMLVRMTGLVDGLVVRPERMRENIERGLGLHASSRVLVALVESGGLLARGGVRDRPARRAAGGRRARDRCATCSPSTRPSPRAVAERSSTPASTRPPSCATCPRSSAGSTASATPSRPAPRSPSRRCPMLAG